MALASALPAAAQTVVGDLMGDTAAQGPWTDADYGRFDTAQIDELQLAALAAGTLLDGPLYATGSGLTIHYLGTGAARSGSLYLTDPGASAGWDQSAKLLFDTRDGYSYGDYLADGFGFINTVGQWRELAGLQAGEALGLGFKALPQQAGSGEVLSPGTDYLLSGTAGAVRVLDLGGGRLLLGFEAERAADWADAVVLIDGVSLAAPVPEPASFILMLAGATLLIVTRRR